MAIIREDPGVPLMALARRASVATGTLYYHLRRFEEAGSVRMVTAGRRRLAFPAEAGVETEIAARIARLEGRTARLVARALLARPGARLAEIESDVGLSRRAVTYHVKQLEQVGLAETVYESTGMRVVPMACLLALVGPPTVEMP